MDMDGEGSTESRSAYRNHFRGHRPAWWLTVLGVVEPHGGERRLRRPHGEFVLEGRARRLGTILSSCAESADNDTQRTGEATVVQEPWNDRQNECGLLGSNNRFVASVWIPHQG